MAIPLLARFPRLRFRPSSYPVIPPEAAREYPALAADLDVLRRYVAPEFQRHDLEALRWQNNYRRSELLTLLSASALSALGWVQAAWPHERWPGILLVALSGGAVVGTRWASERDAHAKFLAARLNRSSADGGHTIS